MDALNETFRVFDQFDVATVTECHKDYTYVSDAFYYLGSGQSDPVNLLYKDSVDQITRVWFTGESTEHSGQRITTFRPDATRGSFGVFYADLSADSVRSFGQLIYQASNNNSLDTRLVLTLKGSPSRSELKSELQKALGNLLTDADVASVLNSLQMTKTDPLEENQTIYGVDLAPLHQEIMARLQTKLMTDERVINAEANVMLQEQELRRLIAQFGNRECIVQGAHANDPGCVELRKGRQNTEEANEAYGAALAEVFGEQIDAGDMPVMDALEEARRPVKEMFAESSLALISLFVPLSIQDAAIDAATYGLGRLRRVGDLMATLIQKASTLPANVLRFAEGVSERIKVLRTQNGTPVAGSPEYRQLADAMIEGPDGKYIRVKDEDFDGYPVYKDENGDRYVFGAEGKREVPNNNGFTRIAGNYDEHIVFRDIDVPRKRGIGGAHNRDEFFRYSNEFKVEEIVPHPTLNGVETIRYRMSALNRAGNPTGEYRAAILEKTVYDPSKISNEQFLDWGRQAAAEAKSAGSLNREWVGTAPNGLEFRGYLDETGAVKSFFPNF